MAAFFELETLKIRINEPAFQALDLHHRVQRALRALILEGLLLPGVKLPSTRGLAKSLGVARDTVENAYVQLQRDGFIFRRGGSGSYVSEKLGPELKGAVRRRAKTAHSGPHLERGGDGLSVRGRNIYATGGVSDAQVARTFVVGLPETRSFPMDVWERLQRQVVKDQRDKVLLHGDSQGEEPLRKSISTYLNLERGANCSPDQVLILSSTRQGLYLSAQLLADAGAPILMENPGYYGARKAFITAEARALPVDVDEFGVRTSLLADDKSGASSIYVTPSHQYPTGVTMSLERRLELIAWASANRKWIIEDDYDSEFHYEGQPTACVQGLDHNKRTIYLGTFSKTLFPGLRMGYMVLPPELVRPFTIARSMMDGHTPQIAQLTLSRFMDDGFYNAHIRAMRKLYAERRAVMFEAIKTHLDDIVTAHRPPGGLQIPCILRDGWSEEDTITRAATVGIKLAGIRRLYAGNTNRQGWLLGYSSLTAHEIEAGIIRLAGVLKA